LQEEAAIFGTLYPFFKFLYDLDRDDRFSGARNHFSDTGIHLKVIDRKLPLPSDSKKTLGLEPIVDEIRKYNITKESDQFDIAMMNLIKGYRYCDGEFRILDLNSYEVAKEYTTSDHEWIRSFAEFLLRLHEINKFLQKNKILADLASSLINKLQKLKLDEDHITRSEFTPIMGKIFSEIIKAQSEKYPVYTTLLSRDMVKDIIPLAGNFWREEATEVFDCLLRIEKAAKAVFEEKRYRYVPSLRYLEKIEDNIKSYVRNVAKDTIEGWISYYINDELTRKERKKVCFLGVLHPFCENLDEFVKICSIPFYFVNDSEEPPRRKRPRCGAGIGAVESTTRDEAPKEIESKESEEKDEVRKSIQLDYRVAIWNESITRALAHYRYDPQALGAVPKDEMILRHQIPLEFLELVFNPQFSNQGVWTTPAGEEHPHWESLIAIDERKYILEVTMDLTDTIYHFYARPLRSTGDYVMVLQDREEYPPLARELKERATPLTFVGEICFDEHGNGLIVKDSSTYKIVKIR
jgi:hypothetical protein